MRMRERLIGLIGIRARDGSGADAGFTLVELLITVTIMGFVLGAVYMLVNGVNAMSDTLDAQTQVTDVARRAVDTMTRELRQAQGWSPDSNPPANWQYATYPGPSPSSGTLEQARQIAFWIDLNNDGKLELVKYKMSGNSLVRTVTSLTTGWTLGAEGAPTVLVEKVSPTFTGPIFTYWRENASVTPPTVAQMALSGSSLPITSPGVPDVLAVGINMTAATTGDYVNSGQTATVSTLVRLRSVKTSQGF